MQISGNIKKMQSSINEENSSVNYKLPIGDQSVPMNELIGQNLTITFEGKINCINCGRKSNKSFAQGHCFPCMRKLASCDTCIVKPELCHFHEGTCREPDWGETNCFTDHFIYLSNTSGLKIGITRGSQLPTRWVDQGAVSAITIYRTSSRRIAGLLEHQAAKLVADKTNWRTMLKGNIPDIDFKLRFSELESDLETIAAPLREEFGAESIIRTEPDVHHFDYPVIEYPKKVSSHNLDKAGQAEGKLMGIKGQYLIFHNGVMNIRKYTGYFLTLNL